MTNSDDRCFNVEQKLTEIYDLNDDEVHVWKYSVTSKELPSLVKKASQILSSDELVRASSFSVEKSRQEFLAGRLCLRILLSHYCNSILPEEWLLGPDSNGKPEIKNSGIGSIFKFNLSHSAGELVFIFCKDRLVGIDIEKINYQESLIEVAKKTFSDKECRQLFALSGHYQAEKFFEFWTLKEAFIKAKGGGLATPMNLFSFEFTSESSLVEYTSPQIVFDPKFTGTGGNWKFFLFRPQNGFQVAAAIGCVNSESIIKLIEKGRVEF